MTDLTALTARHGGIVLALISFLCADLELAIRDKMAASLRSGARGD